MKYFVSTFFSLMIRLSKTITRIGLYPFLEQQFTTIKPGMLVLTVGSGGQINECLHKITRHKKICIISVDFDKNRNPEVVTDICKCSFKPDVFDIVVICEVLEHVSDPFSALLELHRILKPGGKVILSTPFLFPIHDAPYDFYRYTRFGLDLMLKRFTHVQISERCSWVWVSDILRVRLIMENTLIFKIIGTLFIFRAFLIFPIKYLISKIIKNKSITSGYVVTAVKQ